MQFKDNKVWRFFAEKNIAHQTVDLYWTAQGIAGKKYNRRIEQVDEEEVDEGVTMVGLPTLRLGYEEAQTLMQELWNCGLRPDGVGSGKAEVDAMKSHLDSMKMVLGHFMQMQNHGVESELYDDIQKLKQALMDLNPGVAFD